MANYVLALDQGQPARAILFDNEQNIPFHPAAQNCHSTIPARAWVEEDPMEIWSTQCAAMLEALAAGRRFSRLMLPRSASQSARKQRSCGTRPPAVPVYNRMYGSAGVPPILWTASCGRG